MSGVLALESGAVNSRLRRTTCMRLVCPRAFRLGRATARIGPDQMVTPENKPSRDDTQEQLRFAQEECNRLREENARLRTILGIPESAVAETDSVSNAEVSAADSSKSGRDLSTPEGKITLFLNLFRGREDVYAVRWEGKGGKSGYSPAATMDWRAINAARPEERQCVARKTRMLLPLTGEVIRKHLIGKQTVGIYPLLPDETC
jgi:hypothetical protein